MARGDDSPQLGTPIDLATTPNDTCSTCSQCVLVYEDLVGVVSQKTYFQTSGTITFEEIVGLGQWSGKIEDVPLVEVLIDSASNSTPVDGGACLTISGEFPFDTLPSS